LFATASNAAKRHLHTCARRSVIFAGLGSVAVFLICDRFQVLVVYAALQYVALQIKKNSTDTPRWTDNEAYWGVLSDS
jgi:hypothetical protein